MTKITWDRTQVGYDKLWGAQKTAIRQQRTTRKALLERARAQGLKITEKPSVTCIRRGNAFVMLWEDGTNTRGDCALHLARRMTVTECAKVLGL